MTEGGLSEGVARPHRRRAYDWLMTTAAAYTSKAAASLRRLAADVARGPDLVRVVATFTGVVTTAPPAPPTA